MLIEDKASGTQLIQDLIADGCHGVTRYQPTDANDAPPNGVTKHAEEPMV